MCVGGGGSILIGQKTRRFFNRKQNFSPYSFFFSKITFALSQTSWSLWSNDSNYWSPKVVVHIFQPLVGERVLIYKVVFFGGRGIYCFRNKKKRSNSMPRHYKKNPVTWMWIFHCFFTSIHLEFTFGNQILGEMLLANNFFRHAQIISNREFQSEFFKSYTIFGFMFHKILLVAWLWVTVNSNCFTKTTYSIKSNKKSNGVWEAQGWFKL